MYAEFSGIAFNFPSSCLSVLNARVNWSSPPCRLTWIFKLYKSTPEILWIWMILIQRSLKVIKILAVCTGGVWQPYFGGITGKLSLGLSHRLLMCRWEGWFQNACSLLDTSQHVMPFVWWQAFHKTSLNQGCIIRLTRVCHLLALGLWRETTVQCGFLLYPWLRHIQLRTSSSHQRGSGQEARHLYGCPSAREWSETGLRRGHERGDVWLFHLRAFIRDVNLAVRNESLECIKRQSKKALV